MSIPAPQDSFQEQLMSLELQQMHPEQKLLNPQEPSENRSKISR